AQNSYFEQIFDCSESTAIRLLNALADKEYIIKRIIYSEQNPQEVLERRLYINDPLITLVIDEQQ
ncbi:MAG: hypothetical protein LBS99_02985, partial [Clostridiales bacterium]|nr:hypothetical protein [Clostridiales bacterium]